MAAVFNRHAIHSPIPFIHLSFALGMAVENRHHVHQGGKRENPPEGGNCLRLNRGHYLVGCGGDGSRICGDEVLEIMVAPGDGDGLHPGVAGGFEIDGGVSDEDAVSRREVHFFADVDGSGGIWLVGDAGFLPLDVMEADGGKQSLHDGDGEGMGLVGKNGEEVTCGLKAFQHLLNALVGDGALQPRLIVIGLECLLEGIDECRLDVRQGGAGDEISGTVSNESTDCGWAMGGQVVCLKSAIQ